MLKYLAVAKILKKHKPSVDNAVLFMHYRTTFLMFFVASAFVTAKEYFGSPISCMPNAVPKSTLNIYCYIMSTFSVPKYYDAPLGEGAPFPGIGNQNIETADDEITYHAYYQWVPLVLFMQAMIFYIPRFIWKRCEGGLFTVVLGSLGNPDMDENKRHQQHRILSGYMVRNLNLHTFYAFSFFFCEVLAFAIVVGNIYFTDFFLGGTFLTYGTDVIDFLDIKDDDRTDPMVRIFPTMAKCNFRSFGPSGTVEVHDSMCLLPVNIINQKTYIMLWFWLVFLSVVTGIWLLVRLATILSPQIRSKMLQYRGRMAGQEQIRRIEKSCNLGDWFLLYQIGRSVEPSIYAEFLRELAKELEQAPPKDEMDPMLAQ